jgi:hypothetical protein
MTNEIAYASLGFSADSSEVWLGGSSNVRRLRLMPLIGGASRTFLVAIAAVYRPRNPEENPVYGIVARHLETFLARQRERDRHVPAFSSSTRTSRQGTHDATCCLHFSVFPFERLRTQAR